MTTPSVPDSAEQVVKAIFDDPPLGATMEEARAIALRRITAYGQTQYERGCTERHQQCPFEEGFREAIEKAAEVGDRCKCENCRCGKNIRALLPPSEGAKA